jgi:hypothetical protein
MLRHGEEKSQQTIAYIDYGPYIPAAHKQKDYLNFGLWSCGNEIVTEMGYNWNPEWARLWERSERSHNTVFEVASQGEGGKPMIWCLTPGPKIAEAGLPNANSRLIVLLPRISGPPLIVDIFRITGTEETYTWMLHSRFGTLEVDGVQPLTDVEVPYPLRSGRSGSTAQQIIATWSPCAEEPCGLQVIIPNAEETTVTLSECPPEEDVIDRLHEAGGTLKSGATIPYRGHLQLTRKGPDTRFVAIHEPFEGTPPSTITSSCSDIGSHAFYLEVTTEDETFALLYNSGQDDVSHGNMRLSGRCAIATVRKNEFVSLALGAGKRIRYSGFDLLAGESGNAYGVMEGQQLIDKEI